MRYLVLGLLCLIYRIEGKPNGAPMQSCFYMTPRHIHPHTYRKVFPTRAMGLYNITTSADVFRPDRPIRVTLWGPPFKGFMMVAAEEGAKDWPTGIFYSEDGSAKRLDCLGRGDTVTHQNNSYKDSVSVLWYGPENMLSEQVQFVATVVVNLTIYYTNIKSGYLRLDPTLHAQAGGEGAVGGHVTMDPWLAGETATRAPWWNQGGRGGRGSWGLSSLFGGSASGQGWGSQSYSNTGWGSNSYGSGGAGSGGGSSSWWQERGSGYGAPSSSGNSWGNGGWQQWGEPSNGNTSSTSQQGPSQNYQPTSPATTKQSKSEVWSWNWNSKSDPARPTPSTTTPAPPPPSPTTSNPQYAPSWSDNRSLQSTNIWAKLLEFILNNPSATTIA